MVDILDAERRRTEALYMATISSLRAKSWEQAESELSPALEATLSEKQGAQYMSCVRQLHILVQIHWKLSPERSYRKLQATTDAMRHAGVRKTIIIAVRHYLEDNLLPYGALLQVIEGNFTMRMCDVHSLLDRYKWRAKPVREHMHRMLCQALRAMADFREVAQSTEVSAMDQSLEQPELENILRGAHERLNDTIKRIAQQHGDYFKDHLFEMLGYELLRRAEGRIEALMLSLE